MCCESTLSSVLTCGIAMYTRYTPGASLLTLSRPPSEVGQRPGLWRAWRLIVQEELHNELDTFRQSGTAVQDGSLAVDGRAAACRPQRHGLVDLRSLAGQVERCATDKRVCQVEHDGELGHVAVEVEASRASTVEVRRKVLPGDIPRDEETRANAAVLAAVRKLLRHLATQATVLLFRTDHSMDPA